MDKSPGLGPHGDCWEWMAARYGNRTSVLGKFYGGFRFRGAAWLAHRVSYTITHGEIPEGKDVLHTCDNPPCVRPDHLVVGTHLDNMRDSIRKGRHKPPPVSHKVGSDKANAKLNESQVYEMRRLSAEQGMSRKMLGKIYNIHPTNVGVILRRQTWKHVP